MDGWMGRGRGCRGGKKRKAASWLASHTYYFSRIHSTSTKMVKCGPGQASHSAFVWVGEHGCGVTGRIIRKNSCINYCSNYCNGNSNGKLVLISIK